MRTTSRCCRLGAASLAASVAAVILLTGTASAVDRSQPAQDSDGDGRADFGLLRDLVTDDISWLWRTGQTDDWGNLRKGDRPILGDFDGDGRNDPTVYRPGVSCDMTMGCVGVPSTWFIKGTSSGHRALQHGKRMSRVS